MDRACCRDAGDRSSRTSRVGDCLGMISIEGLRSASTRIESDRNHRGAPLLHRMFSRTAIQCGTRKSGVQVVCETPFSGPSDTHGEPAFTRTNYCPQTRSVASVRILPKPLQTLARRGRRVRASSRKSLRMDDVARSLEVAPGGFEPPWAAELCPIYKDFSVRGVPTGVQRVAPRYVAGSRRSRPFRRMVARLAGRQEGVRMSSEDALPRSSRAPGSSGRSG
jgi:hypothetical protein